MLDSDLVRVDNSEELTLALAPKWPVTLDFATCLLLSLDNSQESDAGLKDNDFCTLGDM